VVPDGLTVQALDPIHVVQLFPEERAALLEVLRSLRDDQWAAGTSCPGWSVKDVAQHLVADDLGRLSRERDGYRAGRFEPTGEEGFEAALLVFINRQNEAWVEATRRLSPRIIIELLEWSGRETQAYFESIDPNGMGLGVSWAGEAESPHWFDLAREYTERWHHQAQIREGAGMLLLYEPRLFAPALETFVRGVPHAFRDVDAADGTHVRLRISGPAGGEWSLVREAAGWRLVKPVEAEAHASVEIDQDVAWRLFTKGISAEEAGGRATLSGDQKLAAQVLETVSIIA
jgi:uncharacterized protein (TIGR03083 family)